MKINGSVIDGIGRTPVVRLGKLSENAGAELLGKLELSNPGGSLKDRIALSMVLDAESSGRLAPGATLVEATAGNTGIALAMVAAARGYRFVAIMTESDRGPKSKALEAFGAEVVYATSGAAWDSPEGPIGMGPRIAAERGGLFLDQFSNPANPLAHEQTTAPEIAAAFGDQLDAVVVGVGTGGTATGIARGLKPSMPNLRVIGVAAEGSYLGSELEGDRIAGITPDFPPVTFEADLLDQVITVTSEAATEATRRINRLEGIPAGHSSGACLVAAEREAELRPGTTILLILGDSNRNYPWL